MEKNIYGLFNLGAVLRLKKIMSLIFLLVVCFILWLNRAHFSASNIIDLLPLSSDQLSFKNLHFPVTQVNITAPFLHVEQEEVELKLKELVHTNFFAVELKKIQHSIDQMPWIESMTVERQWPGTINLNLKERVAIAVWQEASLLSLTGDIFNPGKRWKNEENLPYLTGENDQALYVLEMYRKMAPLLRSVDLQLTSLEVTNIGSWLIKVDKNIDIYVDKKDTIDKLKRWLDIYVQFSELGVKVKRVDLRYQNGVAIKWLGERE